MKHLKRFWRGVLVTIVTVLLAITIWAFLTLAVVLVVVTSPVILILAIHGSYKLASVKDSVKDATKSFLDQLEEALDSAEKELDNAE